jgi:hypothetical protein
VQRFTNVDSMLLSGQDQLLNDQHAVLLHSLQEQSVNGMHNLPLDAPSGAPFLSYADERPIVDMP